MDIYLFSSHSITSDVDIIETAKAAEYFLSDGVIITGTSTGTVTDTNEVAGKGRVRVLSLTPEGATCRVLARI